LLIGLEKGLFKNEQCGSVLEALGITVVAGLEKAITDRVLLDDAVIAAAEFVSAVNVDVNPVINELMKAGLSIEKSGPMGDASDIVAKFATLVGLVSRSKSDIKTRLLSELEQSIVKDSTKSPFKLRCIGEIGATTDLGSHTELVGTVFRLIESDDRSMFTAASESAALLAFGSIGTIYNEFVSKATSDVGRLAVWLLGISKLLKQVEKAKTQIDLGTLIQYLLEKADFEKETATSFVDCFATILRAQPSYATVLLDNVAKHQNSSPLASRAIAAYLEVVEVEQAKPVISAILKYLDPANSSTTAGVVLCVKACLRHVELRDELVGVFPQVVACLATTPDQFLDVFYGAERVTVDL
jgi:hypothetical protein